MLDYTHELRLYLNAKMCFQLGQNNYLFKFLYHEFCWYVIGCYTFILSM